MGQLQQQPRKTTKWKIPVTQTKRLRLRLRLRLLRILRQQHLSWTDVFVGLVGLVGLEQLEGACGLRVTVSLRIAVSILPRPDSSSTSCGLSARGAADEEETELGAGEPSH
jgi:hypothetical protein